MELFNTKTKVYPNGKSVTFYCNQTIFHRPVKSEKLIKTNEQIDEETGEVADFFLELLQSEDVEIVPFESFLTDEEKEMAKKKKNELIQRAVSRAKGRIFDIAFCNDWKYFITLTIDQNIIPNADVKTVSKKLSVFLNHCQQRYGLSYLVIPEYHKSGMVHMHGLINDSLKVVDSGTRTVTGYDKPLKIDTIRRKHLESDVMAVVYNLPQWSFGFSTAIPVYGDGGALATYVTKYMTKATTKIFGNYYWSSRDLVREPETVYSNNPDYVSLDIPEYRIPNTSIKLKYFSDFVFKKG